MRVDLLILLKNLIPEISHNEVTRYFDNRPKRKGKHIFLKN